MTPVEIAAIISGCFATGSVGLTAYVAVRGFRSTRDATERTIEAASQDTMRALNAARDDRLWDKRAVAYEETISYLLFMRHQRQFRAIFHVLSDKSQASLRRSSFGNYQPPGWGEIQGRLVSYASDAIVAVYGESTEAEDEASFCFHAWKSAYEQMQKEHPNLESSADDPGQVEAAERLKIADSKAADKAQILIDLIRSELHSRPNV